MSAEYAQIVEQRREAFTCLAAIVAGTEGMLLLEWVAKDDGVSARVAYGGDTNKQTFHITVEREQGGDDDSRAAS